jgi:ADP-heptose:LPS heptosyltransferase
MPDISNIVIYHPGAIGDVMLATPVAAALRKKFARAKITCCTHGSLKPLLDLCPFIDDIQPIDKRWPLSRQREVLFATKPQLIVDLSGSLRGKMLTWFSKARVLRYRKQGKKETPRIHAVQNFLQTLRPLGVPMSAEYPTIFPTDMLKESVADRIVESLPATTTGAGGDRRIIAIVPGVGHLRSHRAWPVKNWVELINRMQGDEGRLLGGTPALPGSAVRQRQPGSAGILPAPTIVLLIGGADDVQIAEKIMAQFSLQSTCLNFTGLLSLPQTAAALSLCTAVVSGDTGPAHIAVAVGVPVVGIYGPTYPERSGPYGCEQLIVNNSHHCRCHDEKSCHITAADGPGDCMRKLPTDEVWKRLSACMKVAK